MRTHSEALSRQLALFFAMMASGGNLIVNRELWVVAAFASALVALRGKIPVPARFLPIYGWIGAVFLMLLFQNGADEAMSTLSRLFTCVTAALLLSIYGEVGRERLGEDLCLLLKPMTIQAILTSIAGNFTPDAFALLDVKGQIYHHLGYVLNFHYVHNVPTAFIRANGLFYEPGVFQIYLSLFLFLAMFFLRSFRWSVIGLVALMSTVSTVGLIVATFLLAVFPFVQERKLRGRRLVAAILALAIAFPALATIAFGNLDQKFFGENRGSFIARQYDFFTALNIIAHSPLTGIGFASDAYLEQKQGLGWEGSALPKEHALMRQNTNGIMQIFYTIGLPLGLPLFFGILRQRAIRSRFIIPVILLLSFMGQALVFSVFFLMIAFSGMTYRPKPEPRLQVA